MDPATEVNNFEKLLENSVNGSHRSSTHLYKQQMIVEAQFKSYEEITNIAAKLPYIDSALELENEKQKVAINGCNEKDRVDSVDPIVNDFALKKSEDLFIDAFSQNMTCDLLGNTILKIMEDLPVDKEKLSGVMNAARIIIDDAKLQISQISNYIISNVDFIPLPILYLLTEAGLVSYREYFIHLLQKDQIGLFKNQLIMVLGAKSTDKHVNEMKFMRFIFKLNAAILSEDTDSKISATMSSMVNSIFEELLFKGLFAGKSSNNISYLISGLGHVTSSNPDIGSKMIKNLLPHFLVNGDKCKVDVAFIKHFDWLFEKMNYTTVCVFQELLQMLNDETMMLIIRSCINMQEISLQRLLILMSCWLIFTSNAAKKILHILVLQMEDAFELQNVNMLKVSLLVARHCSLIKFCDFPLYIHWLQDECFKLMLKDKNSLSLYLIVITDLLPFESQQFLKAHVASFTQTTASPNFIANDYLTLARTRMNDLKCKIAKDQVLEPKTPKHDEFALKQVKKAVVQYKISHEIPRNILEMSIFQKTFFIESFLPALLIPGIANKDINQHNFIDVLDKAGKIPQNLLQQYHQECEAKLLKKEFSTNYQFDDLVSIVVEKIGELLDVIKKQRLIENAKKQISVFYLYVTSLSTHLDKLEEAYQVYGCNLERNEKTFFQSRLVDAIIDRICNACSLDFEKDMDVSIKSRWIKSLVMMLQNHVDICDMMKMKIQDLLCNRMQELKDYHVYGISYIICALDGEISFDKIDAGSFLLKSCLSIIRSSISQWLPLCLRFISLILYVCKEMYSNLIIIDKSLSVDHTVIKKSTILIPSTVIKLWTLFFKRAKFSLNILEQSNSDNNISVDELRNVICFAESARSIIEHDATGIHCEICIEDWLEFELSINPNNDILSVNQKQEYYHCWIESHESSIITPEDNYYRNVAISILHSLLNANEINRKSWQDMCHDSHTLQRLNSFTPVGSFTDLLSLLQSLNETISFEISTANSKSNSTPWILRAVSQWLKNLGDEDNATLANDQLDRLCHILSCLPSFSLYSNHEQCNFFDGFIMEVGTMIENIAKLLWLENFSLPYNFTRCILNSLVSYCCSSIVVNKCNVTKANTIMHGFLDHCPIFCISLVQYFAQLSKTVHKAVEHGFYCFKPIVDLHDAVKHVDIQQAVQLPLSSILISVCIFNNAVKGHCELAFRHILNNDILFIVFECAIQSITLDLLREKSLNEENSKFLYMAISLLKKLPQIAIHLLKDVLSNLFSVGLRNLRPVFVKDNIISLYPLTFLKILTKFDTSSVKEFALKKENADMVLCCLQYVDVFILKQTSDWPKEILICPLDVSFIRDVENLRRTISSIQR